MNQSGHDFDSPMSELGKLEAAALAVALPHCPHCHSEHIPVPMSGTAWGVETFHEDDCPQHEDNRPAIEPESGV